MLDLESRRVPTASRSRREKVRLWVSGLAVGVAFLYYLIGLGALDVVDERTA